MHYLQEHHIKQIVEMDLNATLTVPLENLKIKLDTKKPILPGALMFPRWGLYLWSEVTAESVSFLRLSRSALLSKLIENEAAEILVDNN